MVVKMNWMGDGYLPAQSTRKLQKVKANRFGNQGFSVV
jgi:hypothetical protein